MPSSRVATESPVPDPRAASRRDAGDGPAFRSPSAYGACRLCGCIHRVPPLREGEVARCSRCRSRLPASGASRRSADRTAALTLGAFALWWPAVLLPVVRVERLGHRSETGILDGTVELLRHGEWFVGGVVLLFSVVFPLLKILLLLDLSVIGLLGRPLRAATLRLVEHAGRWSMLDVLLLALLVMAVKLGDLVQFRFGPAVVAFVGCVALSMAASWIFDPHAVQPPASLAPEAPPPRPVSSSPEAP